MTTSPIQAPSRRAILLSTEEKAMLAAYVEEQAQSGQVPFSVATQLTGLAPELLRKLVRDGVIPGFAPWRVAGVVGSCDIVEARRIAEKLNAARKPVEGNKILVADAIAKYGFSKTGMYSWINDGWIKQDGHNESGDMLIEEADVAFARALADLTRHRKAKALFPSKRNK